jgi:hypothetical protein
MIQKLVGKGLEEVDEDGAQSHFFGRIFWIFARIGLNDTAVLISAVGLKAIAEVNVS